MDPTQVFRTFNAAEADLVCSRLRAAGFNADLMHELAAINIDGYALAAGGIKVFVPATQGADAMAFLEAPESPAAMPPAAEPPRSGASASGAPALEPPVS